MAFLPQSLACSRQTVICLQQRRDEMAGVEGLHVIPSYVLHSYLLHIFSMLAFPSVVGIALGHYQSSFSGSFSAHMIGRPEPDRERPTRLATWSPACRMAWHALSRARGRPDQPRK